MYVMIHHRHKIGLVTRNQEIIMTNQQARQLEMIKKHAAAGNQSSAARQLSAMIRAHISPIADRAALMAIAVELGLHSHPDFRR
jgi:hypothetical protein